MSKIFNKSHFGIKLKSLRESNNLTQTELAQALGVRQTTISNWEKGIREPDTIGEVLKISNYFNVELGSLIKSDEVDIYGNHKDNLNYFADKPEMLELYQHIYESETLKLLFDSAKDLTPQDLEMVLTIIKGIRKERGID